MSVSQVGIPRGDVYVKIPLAEFMALPLDQRVTLILEQRLKFYDDKGEPASTTEGLQVLRQMRQARVPAAR